MIVAIDGPSGAGKSTIAKAVAAKLGFSCLDTGAMYRCIAWWVLQNGVAPDDAQAVGEAARVHEISFGHEGEGPVPRRVFLDGVEVTDAIRTGEVDRAVSSVSSIPAVRAALVEQQRRIGGGGNFVVEGRDIGTTVFPDAEVKVFMTASAEERARRRVLQNEARRVGDTDFQSVLEDIRRRDELDSSRDTSPLRPADDAVMLDTSDLAVDEVIERICALVDG